MYRLLHLAIGVLVTAVPGGDLRAGTLGHRGLVDLERQIARDHPGAKSLTAEQFEARLENEATVLVLDARDPAEFGVSRLPGALRIDPGISVAEFMHLYGERVRGKSVLLYCSVGVRSSRLAARIDAAVRRQGGLGAYNLAGGIFSWHNTGRRLVDARGRSDEVHGFDRNWSRYIDFDNLARF